MAIATFKDLCVDANASATVAGFWSSVLGRTTRAEDGDVLIEAPPDGTPNQAMWVNTVPESRTGKTRVHLDIRLPTDDPAPLLEQGARLVRDHTESDPWWVLADPEGNEFCAFGPHPFHRVTAPEPFELVVDSVDPEAQARWWSGVSGGRVGDMPGAPCPYVEGTDGFPWFFWVFAPVPERKEVKNRWHWDVVMDRDEPSALIAAGARQLAKPTAATPWWVLADPEGNEFCAFRPDDQ